MTNETITEEEYKRLIDDYCSALSDGLSERWQQIPKNMYDNERQEVIGALLARQVTLATCIAREPILCSWHIAPLLLRTMIDAYITLAWILDDPDARSRLFIEYGLGQEKLHMEHMRASERADDPAVQKSAEYMEAWINSQHYTFLTEVNIGSWSGKTVRQMANELNELELYNHAYTPFSACAHNMWNHVGKYNLEQCTNPLHKFHKVPVSPDLDGDFDVVVTAAKYLEQSFRRTDDRIGMTCSTRLPLQFWIEYFESYGA